MGGQRIPNKEGDRVITCEPDWHHEIWKLKAQGFDKGIFFLDEAPEADPMVINVARQLVLGLGVGQYKLPEGWFVVLAGNRVKD